MPSFYAASLSLSTKAFLALNFKFLLFFYYIELDIPFTLFDYDMADLFYVLSFKYEYACYGAYWVVDLFKVVPQVKEKFINVGFSFLKAIDIILGRRPKFQAYSWSEMLYLDALTIRENLYIHDLS